MGKKTKNKKKIKNTIPAGAMGGSQDVYIEARGSTA
jgi:hypothetical protein